MFKDRNLESVSSVLRGGVARLVRRNGMWVQEDREEETGYENDAYQGKRSREVTDSKRENESVPGPLRRLPTNELWCRQELPYLERFVNASRPVTVALDDTLEVSIIAKRASEKLNSLWVSPKRSRTLQGPNGDDLETEGQIRSVKFQLTDGRSTVEVGGANLWVVRNIPVAEVEVMLGKDWMKSAGMVASVESNGESYLLFNKARINQVSRNVKGGVTWIGQTDKLTEEVKELTSEVIRLPYFGRMCLIQLKLQRGPYEDWGTDERFVVQAAVDRRLGRVNLMSVKTWEKTGRGIYRPTSLRLPVIEVAPGRTLTMLGKISKPEIMFEIEREHERGCGGVDFFVVTELPLESADLLLGSEWADKWQAEAEYRADGFYLTFGHESLAGTYRVLAESGQDDQKNKEQDPYASLRKIESREMEGQLAPDREYDERCSRAEAFKKTSYLLNMWCSHDIWYIEHYTAGLKPVFVAIDFSMKHSVMAFRTWTRLGKSARRPENRETVSVLRDEPVEAVGRVEGIQFEVRTEAGTYSAGTADIWIVPRFPFADVEIVLGRDWIAKAHLIKPIEREGETYLQFEDCAAVSRTWEVRVECVPWCLGSEENSQDSDQELFQELSSDDFSRSSDQNHSEYENEGSSENSERSSENHKQDAARPPTDHENSQEDADSCRKGSSKGSPEKQPAREEGKREYEAAYSGGHEDSREGQEGARKADNTACADSEAKESEKQGRAVNHLRSQEGFDIKTKIEWWRKAQREDKVPEQSPAETGRLVNAHRDFSEANGEPTFNRSSQGSGTRGAEHELAKFSSSERIAIERREESECKASRGGKEEESLGQERTKEREINI